MVTKDTPKEGEKRETVVAWYNILKAVVDGYQQKTSITHGVQKDAIQNGWDAKIDSKGKGWSFSFELIESKQASYLVMTDRGTTGLTGKVAGKDEYLEGLSKNERWAAFEGYGFTKEDEEESQALGSRGRGKFIFVGASSDCAILYDTLTTDGNYRFGGRWIQRTKNEVNFYDGDKGRKALAAATYDLIPPLNEIGTRVIIVNPIEEVIKAIRFGEFEFMIGETWWEIIRKYDAKITIKHGGVEKKVEVPSEFQLPKKPEGRMKVWLRHSIKKSFGKIPIEIKTLHIACEPGKKVHEDLRGIAIQRNGMKICTVEPQVLPEHIFESIYGYVILDEEGEERIKESEGLEHNDISYKKSFPRELRDWLRTEMKEFAQKELGYNPNPEKERREKQRSAERRALSAINKIAKVLNIIKIGPTTSEPSITHRGPTKPIRISMAPPEFPNPQSTRVDYGQSIKNLEFSIINDTDNSVETNLKIFVRYGSEVITTMVDQKFDIPKHEHIVAYGPANLQIKKSKFKQPGPYVISAKIEDSKTAEKLDQKSITFHVETEPLVTGIFEDIKPEGIDQGEYQYALGYYETGSRGGYVLNYNVLHPECIAVEDSVDALTEHLFRFSALELVKIDFLSSTPKIVKIDSNRIDNADYMMQRYSLAIGTLFYYYRKGKK